MSLSRTVLDVTNAVVWLPVAMPAKLVAWSILSDPNLVSYMAAMVTIRLSRHDR